jgi:hypothetical protein
LRVAPRGFSRLMALETGGRSTLRDEPLRLPPSQPANRLGTLPPERLGHNAIDESSCIRSRR